MALQVNLTLNKTYFLPGEVVQVFVLISNDADSVSPGEQRGQTQLPHPLQIKKLSFQAYGLERTDPSFIHRLHCPEQPVDSSDSRKQVRSIFSTEPAVLVSDQVLAPHAVQHFQLRFRLPSSLPPSFRGTAVRFQYLIQVKAVYRVQQDGVEALAYETIASTPLMIWPGSGAPGATLSGASAGAGPPDRRTSSLDGPASSCGLETPAAGAAAAGAALLQQQREPSRSGAAGAAGEAGDTQRQPSGAVGGQLASPGALQSPTHGSVLPSPSSGGLAAGSHGGGGGGCGGRASGGGDEGDVALCDYLLGQHCRIRWVEIRSDDANTAAGGEPRGSAFGGPGSPPPPASSSSCFTTSGAAPSLPSQRGVIPFGVNGPSLRPFPHHAALAAMPDTDSDGEGEARWPGGGAAASSPLGARVQRQLSGGAAAGGGAAGLCPYNRQPSRRGCSFAKTYGIKAGEQPLLKLLLQAPLEVPLQPGATFGGVLDFRAPLLHLAAQQGAGQGGQGAAGLVTCHEVAVLLESEEVVAAECRPQGKHDSGGVPYIIRRLHAEHSELCGSAALSSFTFSLPASATPSFRSPMVALRWVLRFELTIGPPLNFAAPRTSASASPWAPKLEQLVWSLPLVVRPPVCAQH